MNNGFIKRIRIFIISALVLIVAGMAMFGFMNFNQPIDNRDSYEIQISVDQVAGDAVDVLKDASEDAIKDNGLQIVSEQKLNDGALLIYKLNDDVSDKASAIQTSIQSKIDAESGITGIKVNVEVFELKGSFATQGLKIVLALGIGIIVASIFVLIMNKFASFLAVICSSLFAAILYFALIALTRIPAQPYFEVFVAISMAFALMLSSLITTNYKAEINKAQKVDKKEIACKTSCSLISIFIGVIVAVLICSVIFSIITSVCIGLNMLVSGLVGVLTAIYFTPLVWMLKK